VHKLLIYFSLWLSVTAGAFAAESFTLTDGTSLSGDIVKFDDYDVMIHTSADAYTNIQWPRFTQDTLKELAGNPKYKPLAEPFIAPPPRESSVQAIPVRPVERLTLPEHPSILGGLFHSSLGFFILFVLYVANLYAAFEVAVVRGKPVPAVMGLSAVLPIVGPIIFLTQPVGTASAEQAPAEELPPGAPAPGAAAPGQPDIQIESASWQGSQEPKKPEPQVFARGKFTFNKRFMETKFGGFIGELKGDAKNFSMEIKTLKETIAVESIKQLGQNEAILETPNGQVTLPFADIQEVKLNPRPA
jgi:hypothetical protein